MKGQALPLSCWRRYDGHHDLGSFLPRGTMPWAISAVTKTRLPPEGPTKWATEAAARDGEEMLWLYHFRWPFWLILWRAPAQLCKDSARCGSGRNFESQSSKLDMLKAFDCEQHIMQATCRMWDFKYRCYWSRNDLQIWQFVQISSRLFCFPKIYGLGGSIDVMSKIWTKNDRQPEKQWKLLLKVRQKVWIP